ncbi:MAG: DUF4255 domain-containing protein [Nannocystaceae bacterium]
MIREALTFLKDHLNGHLSAQSGLSLGEIEDRVVFLDGEKIDPITFKLGAITCLMINVEEERTLRAADPYVRVDADGARQRVQPDIRINLYVLFVARFSQYEQGLSYLSRIIEHFQVHRVFDHQNSPELSPRIERLILELQTQSFSEQNEIWNALRTTYHPSMLYRVRMLVLRDDIASATPAVSDKEVAVTP